MYFSEYYFQYLHNIYREKENKLLVFNSRIFRTFRKEIFFVLDCPLQIMKIVVSYKLFTNYKQVKQKKKIQNF